MVATIAVLPTVPSRAERPATFSPEADAFFGALPQFRSELNQLAADLVAFTSGLDFNGTSASSVAIGTGAKTFTTQAGKLWQVGQFVIVARTSAPANYMFGQVTGYSGTSLQIMVSAGGTGGSGTYTDWTIGICPPSITTSWTSLTGTLTLAQLNAAVSDADLAAAGWSVIGTLTTTSGTTQTFTSIPQTYADLLIRPGCSHNSAGGEALRMALSDDNGSNWTGTFETWAQTAAETIRGEIHIPGYRLGSGFIVGSCPAHASNRTLNMRTSIASGTFGLADWRCDAGINALRFTNSGGASFDAGTITLYGR